MPLKIESSAFAPGAEIPIRYTGEGEDLSPPLAWSGLPQGTKSLALIVDDPDAPVRFWWNRFGPMFAAEIRKKRVAHMRFYPQWRWHLDEAFVKVNGKLCYLWRAVDHEGEVLESGVTAKRQGRGAEASQAHHEEIWPTADRRHRRALLLSRGDERGRHRRSPGGRSSAQQSRREFTSAVSTTRTGHAAISKHEVAAKVQLSSC